MAGLAKICRIPIKFAELQTNILYTTTRYAHKLTDFNPGPIPKTPEERRKAAEKYGVPVGAYDHYPDDGMGYGDYPKLPIVSGEVRDDFYPWDIPASKRNFGEPIHVMETFMDETRVNLNFKPRYPLWVMLCSFLGCMTFFGTLFVIFEDPHLHMHPPVLKKQYIADGGKHYDFPKSQHDPVVHH